MDTVIKGFLGVFIFAMIVYLSAGLISAVSISAEINPADK